MVERMVIALARPRALPPRRRARRRQDPRRRHPRHASSAGPSPACSSPPTSCPPTSSAPASTTPPPRQFDVELGPVFVNFVLADEINRAPRRSSPRSWRSWPNARSPSAATTHPLPEPFVVHRHAEPHRVRRRLPAPRSATRPVPDEGQRRLPDATEEIADPAADERRPARRPNASSTPSSFIALQHAADDSRRPRSRRSTTSCGSSWPPANPSTYRLPDLKGVIDIGASPRATLGLVASARALALHARTRLRPARRRTRRRRRRDVPPDPAVLRGRRRRASTSRRWSSGSMRTVLAPARRTVEGRMARRAVMAAVASHVAS